MFKVLVISMLISLPSFASEVTTSQVSDKTDISFDDMGFHGWEFLGCVSSRHECMHAALDAGYHHFRAVHDHYTCGRYVSYACYVTE